MAQLVKNLPVIWETWVCSLGWEDPLEKEKLPTPVLWPGEFHGLYSAWGHKKSDMTEWLSKKSGREMGWGGVEVELRGGFHDQGILWLLCSPRGCCPFPICWLSTLMITCDESCSSWLILFRHSTCWYSPLSWLHLSSYECCISGIQWRFSFSSILSCTVQCLLWCCLTQLWLASSSQSPHYLGAHLEKEMATHSSILAWRIPWTEEPGGLLSMGSHKVGHNWSDLAVVAAAAAAVETRERVLGSRK